MAVNTRARRASTDIELPYMAVGFAPDGSMTQGDRQAVGRCYSGIDAGEITIGRRQWMWWVTMGMYFGLGVRYD